MGKEIEKEAEKWAKTQMNYDFEWDSLERESHQESAIEGYIAGYEAAQPRWISVKERLPEEGAYVVALRGMGVTLGKFFNAKEPFWYCIDPYAIGFIDYELKKTPTHWLPLPPAPEEE